jgi:RimJ/RimL family protein N-acetyltransferase
MIRIANEKDIPVLVEMGAAMHAESPRYRDKSFDPAMLAEFLRILITGEDFCVFIAERGGDPAGMIGGSVALFFFSSKDRYASDMGFYVKPEFRGGSTVLKLVEAYEEWAVNKGVLPEDITLGVSCENKKLGELLGKIGYTQSGELYRKNGRI